MALAAGRQFERCEDAALQRVLAELEGAGDCWNDGPCPEAATILTYSQSANPRSPFFADQGPLFSRKQWVPVRFCRRDVVRHTLSTTILRAPR